jgi:two-component system phosphate regulon response regulator PhoB
MKPVVVLSSDDPEFFLLLQHILETEGYAVCLARRCEQVVRLAGAGTTHAVLLDCSPDSYEAAAICAELKRTVPTRTVPVAALIGASSDQHIDLIRAGIDESLIRPLSPASLLQFLRREAEPTIGVGELGSFAAGRTLRQLELEMNLKTHRVLCNGRRLELAPTGFRLLQHFLKYPDRIHGRNALIGAGWDKNRPVNPRTVDVHVGRLRRCLKSVCGSELIRTIRSAGYALDTHQDRYFSLR